MDEFLVLDSQFINVEVEECQNFNCIICKRVFLTRKERNECLETHLLRTNCKSCKKLVIVIGGLELELHRPTHCEQIDSSQEDVFDDDYVMDNEDNLHDNIDDKFSIESDKVKEALAENNLTIESFKEPIEHKIVVEPSTEVPSEVADETKEKRRRSLRKRAIIEKQDSEIESSENTKKRSIYAENSNDESSELVHKVEETKKRSVRKRKRKSTKKRTRSRKNKVRNSLKCDDNDADSKTEQSESEDEFLKEMKKSRKKLPKNVPCTMCPLKFGTERTLKIHMNKKHGIKERYICSICDREFKISGNLKQHMETHTDYHRFICTYCGKGFHLPFNMKEHMNSHTGVRPYKCETCGKFFGRTSHLAAHQRIHTGEKPYKCNIENCVRVYAYKTDLKRHQRAVHGIIDKTFPCPICGKIFYENKYLTKHLKVH
ncbi:zinc finger protein 652-like [Contarinia nasturtii]|uniref:zinc finger protein 652-like n=1 Tax=Contarinia nasturtii TaxID=265458 RepID=UPI0012D45CC4|nr:zinc finger protein 652-like [Contarinia nasturtii]